MSAWRKVPGRCVMALTALAVPSCATQVWADELIFRSADAQLHNYATHASTTLSEFKNTSAGGSGIIDHAERMASFRMHFWLTCADTTMRFAADVNLPHVPGTELAIRAFPEVSVVTFPDGREAVEPAFGEGPLAVDVARENWAAYIQAGEPETPAAAMIEAMTNHIVWLHHDMLPFIAMYLVARSCG